MTPSHAKQLLDLIPNHDDRGCNDANPSNYYPDNNGIPVCKRCALLDAADSAGYENSLTVTDLKVEITLYYKRG